MSVDDRFQSLVGEAQAAFVAGRLDDAAQRYDAAADEAASTGRDDLADRAFCFRCAVELERDALKPQLPRLQRILLRNHDPKTSLLAAYYAAVGYDLDGDRQKAADYAERAYALVGLAEDPASEAATANLMATLALGRSDFATAEEAFGDALRLYGDSSGYMRLMHAQVLDNLGYVQLCTSRVDGGIELCRRALDIMEEMQAVHYQHQPLQDLCYGHLLQDELGRALEYGERGLELAYQVDDLLVVKNLLFLLGEASVRVGDPFRARRYLGELTQYYNEVPNREEFVNLLMTMDLTRVVNLRG